MPLGRAAVGRGAQRSLAKTHGNPYRSNGACTAQRCKRYSRAIRAHRKTPRLPSTKAINRASGSIRWPRGYLDGRLRSFRVRAIRLGEAQSARQPATFAYLYSWESPAMEGRLGACHGVDCPFVFGLIGTKGADLFTASGPAAEALGERTIDTWLGFARSGDPKHPGLPHWAPFEPGARQTMILGPECKLVSDPFGAERAAWDGVIS